MSRKLCTNLVQLRNRQRLPGESLNDLARAIRQLTRNAYPKAPVEWRETVAKDQLIESLQEKELSHHVYSTFPKTLNEALARAVQLEAFYLEEVKKKKAKPVVRMVEEAPNRENPVSRTRRQQEPAGIVVRSTNIGPNVLIGSVL